MLECTLLDRQMVPVPLASMIFPGTIAKSCSLRWVGGRQNEGDLRRQERIPPPPLSPGLDLKCYHQYVVMAAEYRMCTLRV